MADTEHGIGVVRTASGQLIGNFGYVLTRTKSGDGFEYDLEISEIQKAPSNIGTLGAEALTLDLVAGRKITFSVRGDGGGRRVVVLGPPVEGNAETT